MIFTALFTTMLALKTITSGFGTSRFTLILLFFAQTMADPAISVPPTVAPGVSSFQDTSQSSQRDGEEFSNNLVSDLAPLLALFGERFAQQYMSISTNWIDSFIFAMAPLGIITAIHLGSRVS
ncbi:hypothetical protein FPQ18DRAFT_388452 [Pyronema domesticum]|nr:hypothetical protein FPQ18DRAFT_388452 [Pyronema domesticum]